MLIRTGILVYLDFISICFEQWIPLIFSHKNSRITFWIFRVFPFFVGLTETNMNRIFNVYIFVIENILKRQPNLVIVYCNRIEKRKVLLGNFKELLKQCVRFGFFYFFCLLFFFFLKSRFFFLRCWKSYFFCLMYTMVYY